MSDELELFRLDNGDEVCTGLTMPTAEDEALLASFPEYPEAMKLDWSDIEKRLAANGRNKRLRDKRRKRMRNQARLGKCNGSSNASGLEQAREDQGMPDIAISDCYIYSLANGGQDRGSALATTFDQLQKARGSSPMEVQVGGMLKRLPNDFYNRRQVDKELLAAADREAARIVGWEFYKLPRKYEDWVVAAASALARDQGVVFAWHVGNNSMRLNSKGFMVVGRGPGNHSNLLHDGIWVGGGTKVVFDNQNSWGPCFDELYGARGGNWGEGGFAKCDPQDAFACDRTHGTYVIVSVKADPNDPAFQ